MVFVDRWSRVAVYIRTANNGACVLPSDKVCDSKNKTGANLKKKMKMKAKQAMTQTEIKTAC